MCGRYRLTRAEKMAEKFEAQAELSGELRPRYNIAPTQPVPVVRATGSGRVISSMRWGLIPSWAKDASMAQINARSETVLEKPAFQESAERRRCLIPADGFYEWRRSPNTKQPFHFGMKDDSLFAFAGIWDRWTSTEGQIVESCAILTTTPNELLKDVHDRMPVILHPNHYHAWLTASGLKSHHFAHILVPYDAEQMRRYPVSSLVNSPENDIPACVVEVPELASAQGGLFG
jgi:putative SOS response-associated peptidase YedK